MLTKESVIEIVYNYFPRNLLYDSDKYKESTEYKRLLMKKQEAKINSEFNEILEQKLKTVFNEFVVINWTNFEESNSYKFKILLHENQAILDDDTELLEALNGRRLDLELYVSILCDCFYFFFCETTLNHTDWSFRIFYNAPEFMGRITQLVSYMNKIGFEQISTDIARFNIPDIETEVSGNDPVTIFNCLFNDVISIN